MLEELEPLFQSATIKPTFEKVHIILALFIFEQNKEGIGRYRLQKELLIGSGTARSLIKKLNKTINFITVLTDENKRKGHILTEKGLDFLNKIKEKIPLIEEGDLSILKEIIIESEDINPYICHVKNSANRITNAIAQRDAAIKINGNGATCLIYNGESLVFPEKSFSEDDKQHWKVSARLGKYFKTFHSKNMGISLNLEKDDVIIIGLGDNIKKARLAALNAALTLI